MPESNDRLGGQGKRSVKQTVGMAFAAALGIVALGLAVLGTTQKQVQIGLIVGAWAAIIALITIYGLRRRSVLADSPVEGREVELRHSFQLERERDAADRRRYELQLEVMLRREMERVLREELGALRADVAALRGDLVEKVHGQLQLERIETTRVIGSDLEALQKEVRRLALARDSLAETRATGGGAPTVGPGASASRATGGGAPTVGPGASASAPPAIARAPIEASLAATQASSDTTLLPRVESGPVTPPSSPERSALDPFAGLPQLGRFDDIEPPRPVTPTTPAPAPVVTPPEPPSAPEPGYVGRRRRGTEPDEVLSRRVGR